MRACNELDRLAAARPQILLRAGDVVNAAEEDRMLRQILAGAADPRPARIRTPGHGLARPRRAGLLAAGFAVAAVAVTTAVVLASGTTTVPSGPPTAAHPVPGGRARQVLLAAASAAAAQPAGSGRYWYVKDTQSLQGSVYTVETWTPLHGRTWVRGNKMPGAPLSKLFKQPDTPPDQFSLADSDLLLRELENLPPRTYSIKDIPAPEHYKVTPGFLTLAQLNQLPASPSALLAWITAFDRKSAQEDGMSDAGRVGVFESLTYLVATLPAPPQVRAAAFRAMAAMPGVTSLGPVHGGQGLRFSLRPHLSATLVVDPATSRVRDTLTVIGVHGEVSSDSVTAHWANRLPR